MIPLPRDRPRVELSGTESDRQAGRQKQTNACMQVAKCSYPVFGLDKNIDIVIT